MVFGFGFGGLVGGHIATFSVISLTLYLHLESPSSCRRDTLSTSEIKVLSAASQYSVNELHCTTNDHTTEHYIVYSLHVSIEFAVNSL